VKLVCAFEKRISIPALLKPDRKKRTTKVASDVLGASISIGFSTCCLHCGNTRRAIEAESALQSRSSLVIRFPEVQDNREEGPGAKTG
jgi:hypothetical protein